MVGITTSQTGGWLMNICIRLGVFIAGGRGLVLTPNSGMLFNECQAFVISGGADINPELYGQKNKHSVNINKERDAFEQQVISHALSFKKPLLGICRGMQMINILKGGTLHQNVSDAYQGFVPTSSLWAKALLRRLVFFAKGSYLNRLFGKTGQAYVNSIHHQSIAETGKGIKVTAEDELGVVQAIESTAHKNHFILGVQWHPELLLLSTGNRNAFKALVRYASGDTFSNSNDF